MNADTHLQTIARLYRQGLRVSTFIDIGCADGHLGLTVIAEGMFPGVSVLNVDANPLYEDSLKAIRDVVGGHYAITAIADSEGEIELGLSTHPYWSSLRPEKDMYWTRVNHLFERKQKVPLTTLDKLTKKFSLKGPFLIKMDVQGAEESVLDGAARILDDTVAVVTEIDIGDFDDINRKLSDSGFLLYDITDLSRLGEGQLGWFYGTYIHRKAKHLMPKEFWAKENNQMVLAVQAERRRRILKFNEETLNRLRLQKTRAP